MQLQFPAFEREAQCQQPLLSGCPVLNPLDNVMRTSLPEIVGWIRIRNVRFLFCSVVSTHHHNAA